MEKGDKNGAATQQIKVSVPGPPLKRGASKGGNMSELAPGWQAIKDDEAQKACREVYGIAEEVS